MDHRYGEREATRLPALLRVKGCWIPAVIRNVSEDGLYVETAAPLRNSLHARVDVRIAHPEGTLGGDIPALVIHQQARGLGLMVMAREEEAWPTSGPHLPLASAERAGAAPRPAWR